MNVDEMLKSLEPPLPWKIDSRAALAKVRSEARLQSRARTRYRGLAVAAGLTVMFLLPATRSGAQRLWRVLHTERVSVIQMPAHETAATENRYALPPEILALSAKMLSPGGPPAEAASRADAESHVGYTLRLPRSGTLSLQPRFIVVNPGPLFEQSLDREKFQAALAALGRPGLEVPPAPDGARVRVGLSAGVAALYGECEGFNCDVTLSQAAASDVAVSEGVDLGRWIGFSLQLAGISASDARHYAETMHGVLPVVLLSSQSSGKLRETQVGGAPAALFEEKGANGRPRTSVAWIVSGRMYSLSVRGSADYALAIANSLD